MHRLRSFARILICAQMLLGSYPVLGKVVGLSDLGDRVLWYLHARGLAPTITEPKVIMASVIGDRNYNVNNPQVALISAASQGHNVIIVKYVFSVQ